MSSSFRRSLNSAAFSFLLAVLLASQALGAAVPGQSVTQLPDGRWLLLGGEGSSASALTIAGERGETLAEKATRGPRSRHTATVLPDGRVLVIGGFDKTGAFVRGAEILDVSTLAFENVADPGLTARAGHTATVLMDGRVLFLGGVSPSGQPVPEIEVWNPKTGRAERTGERLAFPRWGHSISILPSGGILIFGGRDEAGAAVKTPELFVPHERRFATLQEAAAASRAKVPAGAPEVAAIVPRHAADDVALDTVIAVRFSRPLRAGSLGPDTVTLLGPGGAIKVRVTAAEGGMLLFVTPAAQLLPATEYTLFIDGAVDPEENPLPFVASGFRTRSLTGRDREDDAAEPKGERPDPAEAPRAVSAAADGDTEVWTPGPSQMRGDWQAHRPPSPLQQLPALAAESGVTALAGQVLLFNGEPAEGVTLRIGDTEVRSDGTGRFLLEDVPADTRSLLIDGGTANRPGRTYGLFEARVMIVPGQTTVLPYTIWLPRINTQHAVSFPSPTTQEVVVTSPHIPGLELRIPAGAVLRDRAGRVVTEVSITPIPVDRAPFPLPTGDVPVYFTIQPGGVHLQSLDAASPQGARLIYPNYTGAAPGHVLDFWNYDPVDKGWYVYGQGKVSADGRQVVPDPGVAIYELTGAMVSNPNNGPPEGPPPGGCEGQAGDPVDCYTGLFLLSRTDLSLPGTMPIALTRTYRPRDTVSRAFGIGTNHAYDVFTVGDIWPYTYQELILPDGGRVRFQRTSPGTSFSDAVYEHTSSPSEFQGAVISYVAGQWRLRMKNGVEMYFADCEGCTSARAAALLTYKDRWGNQLTIQRDANRNVTKVTSPDGRSIDLTYDTSNRVSEARDSSGRVVTYQYDASGRLWKVTNPEAGVEEYGYDTSHRMTTVKKPNGTLMVTNVYDGNGRVSRQTLSDGGVYLFAYTLDGARVTQTNITDPRGNVRRLVFNTRGLVVSETLALGKPEQQTTTYERDAATNLPLAITDALGRRTELSYDARGNATSVTRLAGTPDAVTVTLTYDPVYNQLTSITDGLGHVTELRYDSLGQLVEMEDALGNVARFSYTADGRMATATDATGNVTQFAYEGGDLVATTDPLGRTMTMYTDSAGRLLALTDALGNRYRYDYDRLDRVTKVTDPLGAVTSYIYDANSNLKQITDARGGVTKFTYDAKDRVASITDPLLKTDSYLYDGMDNLTQVTERNGKISTFTYDALDRLKTAEFGRGKQGNSLTAPDATVTSTWDAGNRLIQVVDTQDGTITRGYDALDRLVSEAGPRGSVGYGYDANGRRTRLSIPGQADVTYTYNDANRLTGIAQGAAQVGFAYDEAGRRTTLNLPNGITAESTYDDAGQLTGTVYTRGGVTIGDLSYQYDDAGRRVLEAGSLARRNMPAAMAGATYNAANRLTAWGGTALAYDLNGNLTSDGSRTYTWDSRNRLRTVAGAAAASFGYDAFGRRSAATLSGSTTSFLYDGSNVTQELTGASVKATMLRGLGLDEIFQRTDAAGPRSFLTDALGSALALADGAGVVRTEYRYDPYGATTVSGDASGSLIQYTGRENDGTGLYYYRARYYSPSLGRFISEDPIGLDGGPNPYAYVLGDPLSYTDPEGNIAFLPILGGMLIGGGIDLGLQLLQNGGNFDCVNWGSVALSSGLGALGGGLGGARRAGTEFSHWIPARYFRPSSPSYKPWLPRWLNNELNGSYVSPARHYKHDPFRYPRGWRDLGDKWNPALQQADRIPNWMKGGAAGGAAGSAAGGSGSCDCN